MTCSQVTVFPVCAAARPMTAAKFDSTERFLKPDPKYGSRLIAKFINAVMVDGKKSVARKIVYDCFDIIAKKAASLASGVPRLEEIPKHLLPEGLREKPGGNDQAERGAAFHT